MLDHCSIFHKGGIVLWSRSFTPSASTLTSSSSSPVNSLVREALIERRTTENNYEKDGYAIKWTFVNDLELIFVVAYQRILQLTYAEDLLSAIKSVFLTLYEPFLATFVASLHAKLLPGTPSAKSGGSDIVSWDFATIFSAWDRTFDKLLKSIEDKVAQDRRSRTRGLISTPTIPALTPPSADDDPTTPSLDPEEGHDPNEISRNVEALKNRLKNGTQSPRAGGRRRPAKGSRPGTAGSHKDSPNATDSDTAQPKKKAAKKQMRTWDGSIPNDEDAGSLDYSSEKAPPTDSAPTNFDVNTLVDENSRGTKGSSGFYEIKDVEIAGASGPLDVSDDEDDADVEAREDEIIARAVKGLATGRASKSSGSSASKETTTTAASRFGSLSSLFSRLTGSSKTLTKEDLAPVLSAMKDHLMQKNVAQEIAVKICDGIGESLIGKRVSGYRGIKNEVKNALSDAITRILSPKTSTDLLLAIRTKLGSSTSSAPSSSATAKRAPYAMTFVGVNGVGKSTNLSKVCFWLLQNDLRVLIAACDTFRSGAVEQLRVHVRNLGMLVKAEGKEGNAIELYEKGYGKDAAGIAKEAIAYAKENAFDVVLIDTAGRMQDNEPLMKALAKLVAINNPDKVIFVGEALVGNEAVDQLSKFDNALKNFSAVGGSQGRGIDGMLVTKWDTVDDKVGAALSMTYVTGQPIIFVGCGQTYTDLRQLRVAHVVQALLSD